MPSYILNALLAGIGLSLILGPIGCFVVWRRIAFIGDTLSHGAVAGVALALIAGFVPFWGILFIALFVGIFLAFLREQRWLPVDTWLAIMAHSLLAVGLVIFSLAGGGIADLEGVLFGDILAVSATDVRELYVGLLLLSGILVLIWQPLLSITVSAELAAIEGIRVRAYEIIFMMLVALGVALSVRIIGALLVTAMMIIPAASARIFSRTPLEMVLGSILFGALSVVFGIYGSTVIDVPTAPFIVLTALGFFMVCQISRLILSRAILVP